MPAILTPVNPVSVLDSADIRLQGVTRTEDLINNLPQSFGGMRASEEALGDVKLFRIPEPVTVAAHSIKQVAFLERADVPVRIVYRHGFSEPEIGSWASARMLLARNTVEQGLGVALPAGQVQLFTPGDRPILVGRGQYRRSCGRRGGRNLRRRRAGRDDRGRARRRGAGTNIG